MKIKSICGVVIAANNPESLANFYSHVFSAPFEKEEHGDLEMHFGLDIGEIHLGIHPLTNLAMERIGGSSITIAYNVESLRDVIAKLEEMSAELIIPVRDEGFGNVATYKDPEGNHFEVVELNYEFSST